MIRKTLMSAGLALIWMVGLAIGVRAQAIGSRVSPAPSTSVQVAQVAQAAQITQAAPVTASIVQTVPVMLQVTIPGPDGMITVEVPVLISLDIRIGLTQGVTPSVAVMPNVALAQPTEEPVEPVQPIEPVPTATPLVPEPTATVAAATATPVPPPTATPETAVLPTPTPAPAADIVEPICPDPRAVISRPGVNQTIGDDFTIVGTASHRDFDYYKLEYAQGADIDASETFAFWVEGRTSVVEGPLATVDTTALSNGVYTLKLTVVDTTGNFPLPCTVTFNVEN